MSVNVISGEIIFECLKQHGQGEFFSRRDGLEFSAARAAARRDYLDSHPEIIPPYRDAILKAAITPGMTRAEVIAAWGLLEEDTRLVFGHVTQNGRTTYACFKGFDVGVRYALYFNEDVLVGVRQTDELIAPHERELHMRFAEAGGLFYFYDGDDDELRGSNVDQYQMDWDTAHLHLYTIEIVPKYARYRTELNLKAAGVFEEYKAALDRLGFRPGTAPPEVRSRIALGLLPYPPAPEPEIAEESMTEPLSDSWRMLPAGTPDTNGDSADTTDELPIAPAPADSPAEAEAADSSYDPPMPPEEWFAYVANGAEQRAAFPTSTEDMELLKVEWLEEIHFRVTEMPLMANGVSFYDDVELEWLEGEIIPRLKRVIEEPDRRTVRANLKDSKKDKLRRFFAWMDDHPHDYRYEKPWLVFSTWAGMDEDTRSWLDYIDASWVFTDTLDQTAR